MSLPLASLEIPAFSPATILPVSKLSTQVRFACEALIRGDLAIFPTDTFFALGADALNPSAIAKVYVLKGRNERIPVPILIPSIESLADLADEVPPSVAALAERFWPGPLTIVIWKAPDVPAEVAGGGRTVGVRVPDHAVALEILRSVGRPITGTSANPSGTPPTKSVEEIHAWFDGKEVAVVDAPCGPGESASTVVDLTAERPIVVRQGGVPLDALRELLPDVTVSRVR